MKTYKQFVEATFSINPSRNVGLRQPQPKSATNAISSPSVQTTKVQPMAQSFKATPTVTTRNIPTQTIPPALQPQQKGNNGKLDPSQLVQIAPGHFLRPDAAQKFNIMRDAAKSQGVNLSINNAYRTFEQQLEMARKYGLYSNGGKAAVPGTSNHGWGTAVDLNVKSNPVALQWLRQNANKFGFKNIPREPWHWELA